MTTPQAQHGRAKSADQRDSEPERRLGVEREVDRDSDPEADRQPERPPIGFGNGARADTAREGANRRKYFNPSGGCDYPISSTALSGRANVVF